MQFRLAYVSSLASDADQSDIDAIVAHSALANAQCGVTGVLALDGGRICQILEGPKAVVEALYERIRSDPRHDSIVLLDRCEITRPHFGDWSMVQRRMIDIVELLFSL